MKNLKKVLKWTGIVLVGLLVVIFLAGMLLYPIGLEKLTRTFSNIPVESINIPTDPGALARGKHIAIIWECTKCHGDDLSGKLLDDDPIMGTVPAPNLTSGQGGIGQTYTADDWVRALRHGVKPDGHVIAEMNNYATLSDRDLGDLLAYLKQLPPVAATYPAPQFGPIVPLAPALGMMVPAAEVIDHAAPRPPDPVPGATIEYGQYLATTCFECHSANFTRKLQNWQPEDFKRALQTGVLPNGKRLGSAMPLKTYGEMNDTEVTALWLYLQSLSGTQAQK